MTKIFVGNLDFDATEERIRNLFESHGTVSDVNLATDWETGHSRGFAFVKMQDDSEAEKAIKALNGARLDGRPLTVRPAPPVIPVGFDALSWDR